jgi:lipoprotein NlpI
MTGAGSAGLLCAVTIAALTAQSPRALLDVASDDLREGRITEAVAGFERLLRMDPAAEPYLWQRGIALYYADRFVECRRQFESHRRVNPDDVENAAWHFLCVARMESPDAARRALLPVGPDPRRPMAEVYRLFRGDLVDTQVLSAAGTDPAARFFANLYVGLYLEATGRVARSKAYITAASDPQYAEAGGYMHDIARVHARLRR